MDAQEAGISAPSWQAETHKLRPINEMFDAQGGHGQCTRTSDDGASIFEFGRADSSMKKFNK